MVFIFKNVILINFVKWIDNKYYDCYYDKIKVFLLIYVLCLEYMKKEIWNVW